MRPWPIVLLLLAALVPAISAEGTGTLHVTVCLADFPEGRFRDMPEDECWGHPLEHTLITAAGGSTHQAAADQDGSAVLDLQPGEYALSGDATGFAIEDRVVQVEAGQRAFVVLQARSTEVDVTGHLVDDAMQPVPAARLTFHGPAPWNVTTDGDGAFFATVRSGYHYLDLEVPGLMRGWRDLFIDGSPLKLMALRDDGAVAMSGRVVDQHGQAVPEARIEGWSEPARYDMPHSRDEVRDGHLVVSDPYHRGDFHATAGSDGVFQMSLHPGPARLSAWADGHREAWQEFEVRDGAEVVVVLERLPDKVALVVGTVTDASTGQPIQNFTMDIDNRQYGHWTCSMSADEQARMETYGRRGGCDVTTAPGTFEGALMPGYSIIGVQAHGDCRHYCTDLYVRHVQTVVLEPGQNTLHIELHRRPAPDAAVSGYLLDEAGEPVHAWVEFHSDGSYGSAGVDEFGSYRVMLRPGWHQVSIWAQGFHDWQGMVHAVSGKEVPFDVHLTADPSACCGPHGPPMPPMRAPMPVMDAGVMELAEYEDFEYFAEYEGHDDFEDLGDGDEGFVDMGGLRQGYDATQRKERSIAADGTELSDADDSRIPGVPAVLLLVALAVLVRRRR